MAEASKAKSSTKTGVAAKKTAKAVKEQKVVKKPAAKKAEKPVEAVEAFQAESVVQEADAKTAKAGKRSEKGLKESEEKAAKIEKQQHAEETKTEAESKPKVHKNPTRPLIERRGKKFRKLAEQIEKDKVYGLKEALELAVKTNPVKFDATVELHIRLGVDPRQADQNLRDTIALPAGTGKTVRVAVFADADGVAAAKKAGADVAAADEFLQQLEKGTIDFDILISTPANMPKLGKYARLLGPKGLMPNPKSGTVTTDVAKAVTEAKAGRVEYRVDSTGIVHTGIGKVSFGADKLLQNGQALTTSIKNNRPASIKGNYVKSIFVTTSMGPSIPVELTEI